MLQGRVDRGLPGDDRTVDRQFDVDPSVLFRDFRGDDFAFVRFEFREERFDRHIVHLDGDEFETAHRLAYDTGMEKELEKHQDDGRGQAQEIHPSADRHPDPRGRPDAGRRRESADAIPFGHDHARTQETDARDDLGGDPCRVGDDAVLDVDVVEPVFRDQHEQGRSDGDDAVGFDAGFFKAVFAFDPDDGAADAGSQ